MEEASMLRGNFTS